MRYHALATDYDGTIATHGYVPEETVQAMRRLKESGRKLILVTGRELPDLFSVFPHPEIFDRIVAENGALLYRPETREEHLIAEPPKPAFVEALRKRAVSPLSVGRVIVATTEPNETWVLQAIRDLGLELQVIFNKGAVMVLPSGVNKATGLEAALSDLQLSRHNVVCVGDAENDHAFLDYSECSAAVANALPSLKDRADIVLTKTHGDGVSQLIEQLLEDDLQSITSKLTRHEIVLGSTARGSEVRVPPCGRNLLVAGKSLEARAAIVSRFVERLLQQHYQACVLDTEGTFPAPDAPLVLGDAQRKPALDDVLKALAQPKESVIVRLQAIPCAEQARYLQEFLFRARELRRQTGRPHWIVLDRVEKLLSADAPESCPTWPEDASSGLFVCVAPDQLPATILKTGDFVVAAGEGASSTLQRIVQWQNAGARPQAKSFRGDHSLVWRIGEASTSNIDPAGKSGALERERVVAT